ncbi:MAG: DNA mismatch repair protein MutS [Chloroflexi bacterium]|nr:DNA mismatch repair protein MutS [Chloroflexota bacterium]
MKAFLMYKDRDFDLKQKLPPNAPALTQDLELDTLFNAMALGDKFLLEVAQKSVLSGVSTDLDTLLYRQNVLKDCLENSFVVREIYDIAVESIENERKIYWGIFSKYPSAILDRSIQVLLMFVGQLRKLRHIGEEHADEFESEGLTTFFAMLRRELSDEYFARVQDQLRELKFRDGISISAGLGKGNKGTHYVLRKPPHERRSWLERIFGDKQTAFTLQIADRDEAGFRALSELRDRGINLVANALAQSSDHILSFFSMLRTELAFYVGCLNLHEQLVGLGEPSAFPTPARPGERRHSFTGLYDACLALNMKRAVVGSNLAADEKNLVIITGANQGGKSTFLRSIGLSQLMMQCGMFVPAETYCSNICDGLFTHYKREEDASMNSGKLDEELYRMSEIVDHITPNPVLLFNESFAATNEREGSAIAGQIVNALLEKGIKVFFVTHLFEFARGFYDKRLANSIFLRAERQADGTRTFRIVEGEPLQTSFGKDVYYKVFSENGHVTNGGPDGR